MGASDRIRTFMEKVIDDHKKTMKDGDRHCFLDVYLEEVKKAEGDQKSQFYGSKAERQLAAILFELILAGSDTTSTTISWAILYLCKYPEIQMKLQQEISQVTGDNDRRVVSVDDRGNMPYAVALIDEVLRHSSIAPDGLLHRMQVDKEFKGFYFPKDVCLQPNLYYMHHNPKIWGDPEKFKPERFLSPDGKKYVKSDCLLAFHPGRRQCVGESLARDTIFLYLINIFRQFTIKFDPKMERTPGFEKQPGFVLAPLPYSVVMENRLLIKI